MNPEEIEEERRLAYVAITRAKKKLYITHVHDRMLNGSTQFNQLSRFVSEIPEELIDVGESYATQMQKKAVFSSGAPAVSGKAGSGFRNFGSSSYSVGIHPSPTRKAAPQMPAFSTGDRVRHNTFGNGTILSVRAMGSDTLYEIAFDNAGTKKLMATYAKLTKSQE